MGMEYDQLRVHRVLVNRTPSCGSLATIRTHYTKTLSVVTRDVVASKIPTM